MPPQRFNLYIFFDEDITSTVGLHCVVCGELTTDFMYYVQVNQFPADVDMSDWEMELLASVEDNGVTRITGLCEECARRMASRLVAQSKSINNRIYTGKRAQGEPA